MPNEPLKKSHGETTGTADTETTVKAVGAWVQQFARTLKNCRLYDPRNAAVLRFRQQLAASLHQLVQDHGSFTLRFASDDVTYENASLYPAKSRDDNLALPFYRDGIRAVTFHAGVEPREIDALMAGLIRVTSQDATEDDDLVTMLWQAQLRHIEIDYIPAEGDVAASAAAEGELAPWPTGQAPEPAPGEAGGSLREVTLAEGEEGRSDDWKVGAATDEIEADFDAMQKLAAGEMSRFMREVQAEHAVSPIAATVTFIEAFLGAETHGDDAVEIGRYLPRVLRLAIQDGQWSDAQKVVALLQKLKSGWSSVTFVQELLQPISLTALKDRLNGQSPAEWTAFASFATGLGEPAFEVIGSVLAELDGAPQGKPLVAALVAMCRRNPERLAPWLGDRRPAIVRQTIQMLGEIGGNGIVSLLQTAARNADPRVRAEVITALQKVDVKVAKPLLMGALASKDLRIVGAALQKLSEARDPEVSQNLLLTIISPEFAELSADEKRMFYAALGATGGDEVIPELEAELLKGGWFEKVDETERQAVARCIARIGTPMARMVIEHGAQSRRTPVRDLCRELLANWGTHRG